MGYVNGKEVCDGCGITRPKNSSGWGADRIFSSKVFCPMCQKKNKIMDEQIREIDEKRYALKREKKAEKIANRSASGREPINWGKGFLIFMKWALCFLWGGPYLLYKGIQYKDSKWTIIGAEFTLLIVIIGIVSQLVDPIPEALNIVFGIFLIANIVMLIRGVIQFSRDN